MMGYREAGEGAEGTSRQGELGEDGMRNSRWLSLRCLYTRGSCMAVGHISVSRERGAPPKNQIECKNRINSSWRVESYVGSVCVRSNSLPPSLSLSLGATSSSWDRPSSLSLSRTRSFFPPSSSLQSGLHGRARMTPPRTERPITSHISSYSACLPRTRVMRFAALMKDPLFIDKQSHVRPRSARCRVAGGRSGAIHREIISLGIRIASRPTRARVNARC